ncbi:MAG: autotransporter-associated beta strand repeat-containing protein [Planctomycetia bacterium]|nr:autotransporter-associated beta strand repeat-containing protein [Planctomycetia bacterium]
MRQCNMVFWVGMLWTGLTALGVSQGWAEEVKSGTQTGAYEGDMSLEKVSDGTTGGGTFILNQANTYTGGTTITAGVLQFTNEKAFGSGAITLNGETLQFNSGQNSHLPNNVVVSSASTLDAVGWDNYYMDGTLSGAGDLTIQSSNNGRFGIFLNNNSTAYTGTFNVKVVNTSDAFLVMNSNTNVQANRVHLNDANSFLSYFVATNQPTYKVGMISGSGQVRALASYADEQTTTLQVGNNTTYSTNDSTFSGQIFDYNDKYHVAIEKVGSNTWTLTGSNLSYTGTTTVTAGTLELSGNANLSNSAITVNGGTLKLSKTNGSFQKALTVNAGGKVDVAARNGLGENQKVPQITLNGGTLNSSAAFYSNIGEITLNGGTITATHGDATWGSFLFYGPITVTKDSSMTQGKVMIRWTTGGRVPLTVDAGATFTVSTQLIMHDSNGVSAPLVKLGQGTLLLNGGDGQLLNSHGGTSGLGTLQIQEGKVRITETGTLGTTKLSMNGGELEISSNGSVGKNFTNAVTGTGTLTASGSNWFNFNASLADFSGTFNVNTTGGMNLNSSSGDASKVCFKVASNCDSFSLIDNSNGIRVGMLTGGVASRPSASSSALATLIVGNDTEYTNHTWEGSLWDGSPNNGKKLSVEKTGTNTWTLSNNDLSFTGGLTVSGGVLELASTAHLSGSNVTVKNNATLRNAGTISQDVWVESGGTYEAVANSSMTGTLTLNTDAVLTGTGTFDDVSLARGSILAFDLDTPSTLTLNANAFDAGEIVVALEADNAESLYGQTFNLLATDADILDQLVFDFSNAPGYIAWITGYTDGNVWAFVGNPAHVPEPASWILMLFGILYFIPCRRYGVSLEN